MFKSSTAFFLALALTTSAAWAARDTVPALQPDAPDRHVVVKGDTLWDISARFLKDPWRWPEIWGLNKAQIKDPHWIYPGDVIVLDRSTMRLRLEGADTTRLSPRIRAQALDAEPIPTIPADVIEPFLSQPLVVAEDGLDKAPRIVATEEGRMNLGVGNIAYASGLGDDGTQTWNVYRPGGALVDPDSHETLGYEAIYLGAARLIKAGDPATLKITDASREISEGDRLVATAPSSVFHYAPHAPTQKVRARIISLYDGRSDARSTAYGGPRGDDLRKSAGSLTESGPLSMVALNAGTADGIEPGHVLALYRATVLPRDHSIGPWYMGERRAKPVKLPEERYGLAMVFRTFDRVSYALVMQAERPVAPGDLAVNP